MKGILSGLVAVACFAGAMGAGADERYKFEAYPASAVATKAVSKIDWKSNKDLASYWKAKEAVEATVGKNPDFAGHFVVTSYGCGSGCTASAFVDANDGKVYKAPMNETSTQDGAHKVTSNIIFMSDYRYVNGGPQMMETPGVVAWNEKSSKFEILHKDKPVKVEME
ncbi:hypothetical protein AU074_13595 [Pseudomonas sp. ATCC PTA-122608]|uniref:hypothetical protein n=1 Tax=Pseudomonas sp. ATCC PTA-122608 TaxID=1771311 RepID=UPI00096B940A|nr:hypothetical protein [Pseudomonas sp. ATCC PTA-122608]OLY72204.1 hypothetical protein AU074_13595 [Pseudomonas sp. ATCC PTA-122608]